MICGRGAVNGFDFADERVLESAYAKISHHSPGASSNVDSGIMG